MSRRRKRRKSRKKLAYGVIAVTFILLCFLTYFYLHQSNQTPDQNPPTLPSKAVIVDHLSFKEETKNETFVNASKRILKEAGFDVDYYPGENVTVDFYKNLAWQDYGLVVLRVHSAIIGTGTELGLFTSERFDETKYNTTSAPYFRDVLDKRLVEAYFEKEDPIHYFAIAPGFVEKYGTFQNTIVIMMGCGGLKYNRTAEAFIKRGAKVCIGWDGNVSTPHTDHSTTCLLQSLLLKKRTIKEAVEEVDADPDYESVLKYYPDKAGNYVIPNLRGGLTVNVAFVSPTPKAPLRSKHTAH